MLDSTIDYESSSTMPSGISTSSCIQILHNFDAIVSLNSDYNGHELIRRVSDTESEYKVDEQLAFIPRKLWQGGVKYKSIYTKLDNGCDITVDAPFFESINRWRIEDGSIGERVVSIRSSAKCARAFASAVKKFLERSHEELRNGFTEKVVRMRDGKESHADTTTEDGGDDFEIAVAG